MPTVGGKIYKCKCNSVWCSQCFKQRHIDRFMKYFKEFRWRHTREIILTVDPKKFNSGEDAYKYVFENKLIPRLIRNIQRGKKVAQPAFNYLLLNVSIENPLLIYLMLDQNLFHLPGQKLEWIQLYEPLRVERWQWFMEFHSNGFPHWHLFLDVQHQGFYGQIGKDRINHYWTIGSIREDYIKSIDHFRNLTSYFRGHGYFEHKGKDLKKGHQMDLPEWGRKRYGAFKNIRRSAHKTGHRYDWEIGSERAGSFIDDHMAGWGRYLKRKRDEYIKTEGWHYSGRSSGYMYQDDITGHEHVKVYKVDTYTGECSKPVNRDVSRSYKAMLKDCGSKTKVLLHSEDSTAIGIFEIPYKTVRGRIPGTYQKGVGYTFRLSKDDFDWLFSFPHHIEDYNGPRQRKQLTEIADQWRQYRRKQGVFEYYRHYA